MRPAPPHCLLTRHPEPPASPHAAGLSRPRRAAAAAAPAPARVAASSNLLQRFPDINSTKPDQILQAMATVCEENGREFVGPTVGPAYGTSPVKTIVYGHFPTDSFRRVFRSGGLLARNSSGEIVAPVWRLLEKASAETRGA